MALAYLRFEGINGDTAVFSVDIGTSKYYRYIIGSEQNKRNGLEQVNGQSHVSDFFSQDFSNAFNSQFKISIPVNYFSGNSKFIQLYSYREKNGDGPALSNIEEVFPQFNMVEDEKSSTYLRYGMGMSQNNNTIFNNCRNASFSFSEAEINTGTLVNALIEVAKILCPVAVASAGELIKQESPGTSAKVDDKAVVQIINSILDSLKTTNSSPVNGSSVPAIEEKGSQAKSFAVNKRGSVKLSRQFDGGIISGPVLAGLITTLAPAAMKLLEGIIGPLAQQAPKILEIVYDNPIKLLNAVNEAKLQSKHEDNTHVENLLAESNKGRLGELLLKNNISAPSDPNLATQKTYEALYITSDKIRISSLNTNPLSISGKSKYVYSNKDNIRLLANITSDEEIILKPIPLSGLHLVIKDSLTMKMLLEKKIKLKDTYLNSMQEIMITKEEAAGLPVDSDLLVSISFKWQSKGNIKYSTKSDNHCIYITNGIFINGFGDAVSEEIPLTDMSKYRVFWNKIWEGSSKTQRRWEADFNTKYYTYYNYKKDSNGRIETKMKIKNPEADTENSGKFVLDSSVKSGFEFSPEELNKLIPEISGYNLLNNEQLQALKTEDISKSYNQEASANLKLKGKEDELGAVWVYPEITIHKVSLYKVQNVNEYGQVTDVITEEVYFPKPSSVHFLGVKTDNENSSGSDNDYESTDDETDDTDSRGENIIKIYGYQILFNKKINLFPVELVPVKNN